MLDFRPRPARTLPNFARPSCSKRERHDRTVLTVTPACSAIRTFATPSTASSSTRARCTCRNGAACDFAITANASRCPSDTTTRRQASSSMKSTTKKTIYFGDTPLDAQLGRVPGWVWLLPLLPNGATLRRPWSADQLGACPYRAPE